MGQVRSTDAYEGARDKVAGFINAASRSEVIFTRGATEAINLVAQTWGRANLGEGDEIILTVMEHHSNLVPWQMLAEVTLTLALALALALALTLTLTLTLALALALALTLTLTRSAASRSSSRRSMRRRAWTWRR